MTDPEKETLAAEYALGLLEPDELARCHALAEAEPAFAGRVERWRRHFCEIDMTAPPQPPGADLWARIESTAFRATAEQVPAGTRRAARFKPLAGLWDSLAAWRALGLVAAAASVALALGLAMLVRDVARTPTLVAVMMSDQNRPLAVVNAFRDGRIELVPLEALAAPEGKSLQVWTLWDRSRGPVSVGLLEAMRSIEMQVKGLPATIPDQLFEVTLEPAGGSPTGRPTGPILMKGNAARTDVGS